MNFIVCELYLIKKKKLCGGDTGANVISVKGSRGLGSKDRV